MFASECAAVKCKQVQFVWAAFVHKCKCVNMSCSSRRSYWGQPAEEVEQPERERGRVAVAESASANGAAKARITRRPSHSLLLLLLLLIFFSFWPS